MEFFEELKWRNLVKDVTDEEGLTQRLKQPAVCYCGFDPTADSLHIGHLQQIMLLCRYQKAGHKPIALCGGATGMIGDPRMTSERKLLQLEDVRHNADCIKQQLSHFLVFDGPNAAVVENNYNWLGQLSMIDFLRDYGKFFNVNYMIAKDTVAKRLETGISFTEFAYTILQSIDWLHLYDNYNCQLQIGGSDQWGNLTSGIELIRKVRGDQAKVFGITSPLITKSDGTKFGKSEGKNIWLDPKRTSAYEFYQWFINVADTDIINFLKRLSLRSPEEIMDLESKMQSAPEKREAQKALAEELTALVHGVEGLATAQKITKALFSGQIMDLTAEERQTALADAQTTTLSVNTPLPEALVIAKVASSKREARQLIEAGSVSVNGQRCQQLDFVLSKDQATDGDTFIIRKGKKNYFVFKVTADDTTN